MKRTLLTFIGFMICSWASIQLWLAGYQSGYEEGSSTAWTQARQVLQPAFSKDMIGGDETSQLNWKQPPATAQLVENRDI